LPNLKWGRYWLLTMKGGARVWIKRLTGLSIVLILVFVGTYGESTDRIIEKMNVEENNLLELDGGEEENIELKKIGFYTVVALEDNELLENEIKLIDQEGQEIIGIVPNSIEKMNKRPNSNGELVYVPILIFDVPNNAEYQLINEGNNTLWILDDLKIQSSLISDNMIIISMVSCCFGFPLGMIALIGGLVIWKRKNKPQQKMIIREEIPTTDQLFKQYNSTADDEIPSPFVDLSRIETIETLPLDDDISEENLEIHDEVKEDETVQENDGKWKNWDDGD